MYTILLFIDLKTLHAQAWAFDGILHCGKKANGWNLGQTCAHASILQISHQPLSLCCMLPFFPPAIQVFRCGLCDISHVLLVNEFFDLAVMQASGEATLFGNVARTNSCKQNRTLEPELVDGFDLVAPSFRDDNSWDTRNTGQ